MGLALVAVLAGLSTVISLLTLFVLSRLRSDGGEGILAAISKNSMDLSNVITRATGDIRQEITEKLNDKFTFITRELNERLEAIGKEVQTKLDKNIQDGFAHFQKVQESLIGAEKQLANLNAVGQSIQELNNVLNLPHLRGKIIGEGNLERLLADFLPAGFFERQYSIDGALVDFVIKFPHINLVLPIDSKFSMEQVAPLFDHTNNPDELKAARKKLAEITKQNAKDIKNKYIKPKLGTTDYALMYLPSETLYFEVVRDTELWGALTDLKVFPVSPNTLAITINSIGKSLQYYEMAKGVQKTIMQIQTARDHLGDFKKRFDDIGEKLNRAQDSFQKANTHLTHYSSSVDKLGPSSPQQGMLLPVESEVHLSRGID